MADFLAAPVRDNPILRQTAMPPATIGEGFSSGLGTPALGGLAVTQEQIRVYEEAARRGLGDRPRGRPTYEEMETMRRSGRQPTPESVLREYRTRMLSRDELEERYKDLGLKFEGPMSEGAAKILADTKKAELIRKDVMARLGTGGTVAGFGGGLLAMLMDPLEVATAFLPVLGPASKGAMITRLGVMRGRIAIGATEGFVGNLITEPFYAGLSSKLQLDYQMADAALNLAFGAGLGGIGGTVGGALARRQEARVSRMADEARAEFERLEAQRTAPPADMVTTPRPADLEAPSARQAADAVEREQEVEAFRTALAQAAQGRTVETHGAPVPRKEESLLDFIARRGGINDDAPTYRGEIEARGNPVVGQPGKGRRKLASKDAKLDLDDIAELAHEEGFIPARDVRQLLDKIDQELRGQRVYRPRDMDGGEAFDTRQDRADEAQQELDAFDEAQRGLEEAGISGASVQDIRAVSRIMERDDIDAEAAFERLAIEEMDPARDFSGDPRASKAADDIEDFDPLQEVEMLEEMIDEMRGGRAGGDILDTDGPWRDATVKVQDEDGNAANVNAGFAVDTLKHRLDQARQILECVNA